MIRKLLQVKGQIFSIFGQVVFALSSVPRYRSQNLSDLSHLVIDPLSHDRIVIASKKEDDGAEQTTLAPNAIAIWASVSADVDAKIVEQVKAGVFPVRLKPTDWNSGQIIWLLDVIAPTRELATSVLSNFHTVAKQSQIKVHPVLGCVPITGFMLMTLCDSISWKGDCYAPSRTDRRGMGGYRAFAADQQPWS
ncbi:toxin-activating lysine-acyltransferase [Agrobacterium sp. 22-226-1]